MRIWNKGGKEWESRGAGGKEWVPGGTGGKHSGNQEVQQESSGYLKVVGTCRCRRQAFGLLEEVEEVKQ